MDDDRALDERGERLGHRRVEPANGLRPTEDQQHPVTRCDAQPLAGGLTVDRGRIADGCAGQVAGCAGRRGSEGLAGGRERHRQHVGEPGRRTDRATRDHVAVPQHDRDAERRRGKEDRDCHVTTGREDRGWSLGREDRCRLRHRCAEAQRVEDRMHVELRRAQRAQRESPERYPGARDDARLETPMPAEPDELSAVRARAQRAGDGQRRVDVPARSAAGDQQSHRRSRSPSRWSRARSRGGSRSPRS